MVLVKAMARRKGRMDGSPRRRFSGFCSALQQPMILAASVMLISPPSAAKWACRAASTCCSDMASTTTL